MANATNITTTASPGSVFDRLPEEIRIGLTVRTWAYMTAIILGLPTNLWLLLSIVTSSELRAKVRNQIICNMLILHLITIVYPYMYIFVDYYYFIRGLQQRLFTNCLFYDLALFLFIAQEAINDCFIAALCVVFLAQTLDFDPAVKLKPTVVRVGKLAGLLVPWVFGAIATFTTLCLIKTKDFPCLHISYAKMYIFETVFTVIPLCVSAVLVTIAAGLRWRRFGLGSLTAQGNMAVHLMGTGVPVDNSMAYIAAVTVCVLSQICVLIIHYEVGQQKWRGFTFSVVGDTVGISREILLPLVWLFLTDIRQRFRAWRPWRRTDPHTGIDLTVIYNKDEEEDASSHAP